MNQIDKYIQVRNYRLVHLSLVQASSIYLLDIFHKYYFLEHIIHKDMALDRVSLQYIFYLQDNLLGFAFRIHYSTFQQDILSKQIYLLNLDILLADI